MTTPRTSWRERCATATAERALSDFWAGYVELGQRAAVHVIRHPLATVAAVAGMARLPHVRAELPDTHEGRVLHRTLTRPGLLHTPFGRTGVAVLEVPADPDEYSLGADRQTLRRKVRSASKQGVTWRLVDDPAERMHLLALANQAEIDHADETYRNERPDNRDLLDVDLWLVAVGPDGAPVLLSVTPTAGDWALLRYFRRLGNSPVHSDTRYLMTQALVETLARRGVRHLVEGTHPAELPNGLRHFQRMVGFRLTRVSARRMPAPAANGPAAAAELPEGEPGSVEPRPAALSVP
jgi:hypothetical protein